MSRVEITFTGVVSVPADEYSEHAADGAYWADKALYYGTKHADIGVAVLEITDVRELNED